MNEQVYKVFVKHAEKVTYSSCGFLVLNNEKEVVHRIGIAVKIKFGHNKKEKKIGTKRILSKLIQL